MHNKARFLKTMETKVSNNCPFVFRIVDFETMTFVCGRVRCRHGKCTSVNRFSVEQSVLVYQIQQVVTSVFQLTPSYLFK